MTTSARLPSGGCLSRGRESMSSVEVFNARRSRALDTVEGSLTSGGDGRGWQPSFAWFDPDTCSLRMCLDY